MKLIHAQILCCALAAMTPVFLAPATAQEMEFVQRPAFGRFAITDNNATHSIVVTPDNTITYDPAFIPVDDARHGIFNLKNLPAFTLPDVSIAPTTLSAPGNPDFNIISPTHIIAPTDVDGNTVLYVGATLQTTGSGENYRSGAYTGIMEITIQF
jgi:hypothetical protein